MNTTITFKESNSNENSLDFDFENRLEAEALESFILRKSKERSIDIITSSISFIRFKNKSHKEELFYDCLNNETLKTFNLDEVNIPDKTEKRESFIFSQGSIKKDALSEQTLKMIDSGEIVCGLKFVISGKTRSVFLKKGALSSICKEMDIPDIEKGVSENVSSIELLYVLEKFYKKDAVISVKLEDLSKNNFVLTGISGKIPAFPIEKFSEIVYGFLNSEKKGKLQYFKESSETVNTWIEFENLRRGPYNFGIYIENSFLITQVKQEIYLGFSKKNSNKKDFAPKLLLLKLEDKKSNFENILNLISTTDLNLITLEKSTFNFDFFVPEVVSCKIGAKRLAKIKKFIEKEQSLTDLEAIELLFRVSESLRGCKEKDLKDFRLAFGNKAFDILNKGGRV